MRDQAVDRGVDAGRNARPGAMPDPDSMPLDLGAAPVAPGPGGPGANGFADERPTTVTVPPEPPEPTPSTPAAESAPAGATEPTEAPVPTDAPTEAPAPAGALEVVRDHLAFALVLLVLLVGGIRLLEYHWRQGSGLIAGALFLAALFRALLPDRRAGLLVVRSRAIDVLSCTGLGVCLLWIAVTLQA